MNTKTFTSDLTQSRSCPIRILLSSFLLLALSGQEHSSVYAATPDISSYAFNFDEFLEWQGDRFDQAVNDGVYLQEFATDEWSATLNSSGSSTQEVTYDSYFETSRIYDLSFRAKIDSYSSGNSWPLRIIVRSGSENLILAFEDDGIFYINSGSVKTFLTSAAPTGVWRDYHIAVDRNSARLRINGGAFLAIDSLKPVSGSSSIQLSTRGNTSSVAAQVDYLRVAPRRSSLIEEWPNLSEWTVSGAGSNDFVSLSSGSETRLNITSGTQGSQLRTSSDIIVSEKYSLRTAFRVNSFGSGGYMGRFGAFSGSHLLDIEIQQSGLIAVRNASNAYVGNSANRTVATGETVRLEMLVFGSSAELWELSSIGDTLLHSWNLPINGASERVRILANVSGGDLDVFHLDYADEILVDEADPEAAHAFIDFANGEQFGVSQVGGGYGSQLHLTASGPNVVGAGFGAGWISALRSDLQSSGDYNPTQAGTTDAWGTPAILTSTTNASGGDKVIVSSFETPLFMLETRDYDWMENEPIESSTGTFLYDRENGDSGNSDVDGIDEFFQNPESELMSEFNFSGEWEDATHLATTGDSILQHKARWDYSRSPDAILQFNKSSGGITEARRVRDLSPTQFAGDQEPTDIDTSFMLNTYSIRLLRPEGYDYFMWKENGVWQSVFALNNVFTNVGVFGTDTGGGDAPMNATALGSVSPKFPNLSAQADLDLIIISKTGLSNDPDAVGLYFPWDDSINADNVVGYHRSTGAQSYTEDRRVNAYYQCSLRSNKWMTVFLRMWSLGIQAPDHGDKDVYESLRANFYHVMGTPDSIYSTVQDLVGP